MPSKYTQHKLSDAMLQRLSRASKGKRVGGISVPALVDRGLLFDAEAGERRASYQITDAGRDALAQARREGW